MSSTLALDPDTLTIGDLEDFESVVGRPIFEALAPKAQLDDDGNVIRDEKGRPVKSVQMDAKSLKAIVWITSRRDNPDFTLEDARNVKVSSFSVDGDDDAEPVDPTEAAS